MTLMTFLPQAQRGTLFADAGKTAGLSPRETEQAMEILCPAIAEKLKEKSASDPDTLETLLDLLDDGGAAEISLTNAEAIEDGNAILEDIYGSRKTALEELQKLVGATDISKLAPLSATSVLAALVNSNRAMPLAGAQQAASKGIVETFISVLISTVISAIIRQLTRRKTRNTTYATTRRKPRTAIRKRRTTRTASLEDIFSGILKPKR